MRTWSTSSGGRSARATASRIATAPRSVAEQPRSPAPNLPTGVLTADTMTELVMLATSLGSSVWSALTGPRTGSDAGH